MGRNRSGIDEKILKSAGELFYLNGYPNTGIAEIVEHAGTNKTSFYHYYTSKEELGRKYINHFHRGMLRKVIRLMRKHENPVDFCQHWFRLIQKSSAMDSQFNGCPLANYNSQLQFDRDAEKQYVKRLTMRWLKVLTIYFNRSQLTGQIVRTRSAGELARMLLLSYQGALTSWKMSGDPVVFDDASEMIVSLIRN